VVAEKRAKLNVNVRIDAGVKEKAVELLDKMGIDQTTAIDMFYRQIIAVRGLPFQPKYEPSLEEQIYEAAMKGNPEIIKLKTDESGHIIINKDEHPELYDWAVNG
jgi:DNA-damage-inducible protein J